MIDTPDRAMVQRLLGLDPAPTYRPLEVRRRPAPPPPGADDVRCEHVVLLTADGEVPCWLLTPGRPRGVAVLALHQHGGEFDRGKSEVAGIAGAPHLAYGLRLAQAGAVVLAPDLVGFEERQRGWTADASADEDLDAFHRIAAGGCLQAQHTRDVAVATSWLREEAGAGSRLGVVGHSLGGQVALFAMAFDPRLTSGVVSCGAGTVASLVRERIPHNPSWFVPGLLAAGDLTAVAATLREQRVLLTAGRTDHLFTDDGVRDVVAGFAPGVCTPLFFDGGHELPDDVTRAAVEFLLAG
ncbi:alpha/beta hydrolase family protein [Kineococcus sp. TBRC 1896]|uniref:Alpha/beta hydrolase family protein n=1 Tax=Kineococcus mangrovi TaxID=1660183 RepID=A0ABV4I5Z6_9ACTN